MNESSSFIFILPIIAALIGWATNFVAIKMLFHPQDPKKILGITFQGVFPKRQKQIAERLGELVAIELFSIHTEGNTHIGCIIYNLNIIGKN